MSTLKMQRAIDAIFENGTFRPVHRELLAIPEGQRVRITVDDGDPESLRLAISVYDGLSDDDIDEIEKIALDRSRFFDSMSGNWTQGENLDDLKEHLRDLYEMFSVEDIPGIRKVEELEVA